MTEQFKPAQKQPKKKLIRLIFICFCFENEPDSKFGSIVCKEISISVMFIGVILNTNYMRKMNLSLLYKLICLAPKTLKMAYLLMTRNYELVYNVKIV
jgi:hypothetical protein